MKLVYSLLSGALAALASVAGKLAFNDDLETWLRIPSFIGLLVLNATMLSFFVKAMRDDGSVISTTVNMCANVLVTALIGAMFWGEWERMTPRWLAGAVLVLLGVFCIANGQRRVKQD